MNAKENGWTVGVKVFVVETMRGMAGKTYHATVVKVGRTWVTFQQDGTGLQERFDHASMWIDGKGYSSPGRVYLSEQDYLDDTERRKEWTEFCRRLNSYNVPPHLTLADIREIAAKVKGGAQ